MNSKLLTGDWGYLTKRAEDVVHDKISERTKNSWDENTITFTLMDALQSLLAATTIVLRGLEDTHVTTSLFKAKGKLERDCGDVAVIVRSTTRDDIDLEGVAFYEAKKKEWRTTRLASIRKAQLTRLSRVPHARLLVYDHDPITSHAFDATHAVWRGPFLEQRRLHDGDEVAQGTERIPFIPYTFASAIPLDLAVATKHFDTSLYRFAHPFSYQLCYRNFRGFDLCYDRHYVELAKGQSTIDEVASLVLMVGVAIGRRGRPSLPELAHDRFEPVQSP